MFSAQKGADRTVSHELYLARHATPDMTRTDIAYAVPPGPPLSAVGVTEAQMLGRFLRAAGVVHVYASPFARAHRTAEIVASDSIPVVVEHDLGEWREHERGRDVVARVEPLLTRVQRQHARADAVCLVSHGGVISVMLRKLGMDREVVDAHCHNYGGGTPMPPAGVWRAVRTDEASPWQFDLVFTP